MKWTIEFRNGLYWFIPVDEPIQYPEPKYELIE